MHIYLASSWRNTYYPSVLAALRAAGHEVYDFRDPDNDGGRGAFNMSNDTLPAMASADCKCEHSSALAHGFNMSNDTLPAMASADCKCEHSSALAHGFKWSNIDPDYMDWTPEEYREQLYHHPLAEQQFQNDLRAIHACDCCVLLLPCGRSAHTEAGYFAGQGKPVFVLIPEKQEPDLMYRLFAGVCVSTDELITELDGFLTGGQMENS